MDGRRGFLKKVMSLPAIVALGGLVGCADEVIIDKTDMSKNTEPISVPSVFIDYDSNLMKGPFGFSEADNVLFENIYVVENAIHVDGSTNYGWRNVCLEGEGNAESN